MEKYALRKRIIGILLIIAIVLFLYDNTKIFSFINFSNSEQIMTGNFVLDKKTNIRQLKADVVSFNRSYSKNYIKMEVQNIDEYPGNITIYLTCTDGEEQKLTKKYFIPFELITFEIHDIDENCNNYRIEPGNITVS